MNSPINSIFHCCYADVDRRYHENIDEERYSNHIKKKRESDMPMIRWFRCRDLVFSRCCKHSFILVFYMNTLSIETKFVRKSSLSTVIIGIYIERRFKHSSAIFKEARFVGFISEVFGFNGIA